MHRRRRGLALSAFLLTACSSKAVTDHEFSAHDASTTSSLPATTGATTSTTMVVATTTTVAPITIAPTTTRLTTTIAPAPTTIAEIEVALTVPTVPSDPSAAGLPTPQAPPDPNAIEAVVALGSIAIPRLGLDKSLFEGITLATLNRGPGHWPGSALPGALGNVVVGGHRTSKGRPFRHLERLVPGDEVTFTTDAGRFVYRVVRTEIVTPDAIWIVDQTRAYTATLFACHPVGSTKQRIVVFLELSV